MNQSECMKKFMKNNLCGTPQKGVVIHGTAIVIDCKAKERNNSRMSVHLSFTIDVRKDGQVEIMRCDPNNSEAAWMKSRKVFQQHPGMVLPANGVEAFFRRLEGRKDFRLHGRKGADKFGQLMERQKVHCSGGSKYQGFLLLLAQMLHLKCRYLVLPDFFVERRPVNAKDFGRSRYIASIGFEYPFNVVPDELIQGLVH